jgi:branched-chain amino acid transport system permease protein
VTNWSFAGGAIGLMGPATPRSVADLLFRSALPYYALFLVVLAVLLALTWWMQRSRMGFYLRALGSGERAAESLGVPIRRYKLYALLISGAFTALAGSLYAVMVGFVDPNSGFGILISVNMVVMAALGGTGTLFGPLVGAIILVPLAEMTNALLGGGGTGAAYVAYGVIIMLIARFSPGGLAQWAREIGALVGGRRRRRAA